MITFTTDERQVVVRVPTDSPWELADRMRQVYPTVFPGVDVFFDASTHSGALVLYCAPRSPDSYDEAVLTAVAHAEAARQHHLDPPRLDLEGAYETA